MKRKLFLVPLIIFLLAVLWPTETRAQEQNVSELSLEELDRLYESLAEKCDEILQNIEKISNSVEDLELQEKKRVEKANSDLKKLKNNGTGGINSENIFYLTNACSFSDKDLNIALEDTALEGLGGAFKAAEENYSINAVFLMAVANHESNYGQSALSKDKNNLFGFTAYDGSAYESGSSYKTKEDCIDYVGKFVAENYLNKEGIYYNGVSTTGINVKYASDQGWAKKVDGHMIRIANKILETY